MSQSAHKKYELVPKNHLGGIPPIVREFFLKGFGLVPKNFVSWVSGGLSRVKFPRPLKGLVNSAFIRLFKIDMSEAEYPPDSYKTIEEIFTRKLKPHTRPIGETWVSPADGFLIKSEAVQQGQGVQAKGYLYDIRELIGESDGDKSQAWYQTVYLAPHNYHRVHAPTSGTLTRISYIPGELWPVNELFLHRVPRIFVRNERLVFQVQVANGGWIWIVMVGAFNVGRMTSPLAPFLATNSEVVFRDRNVRTSHMERPINIGEELGTFMLGSTVIIVLDHKSLEGLGGSTVMVSVTEKTLVQMGQRLIRGTHD